MARRWRVRVLFLLIAAGALANGGCLAVALGTVAAGTAAGYAVYQRGQWYQDYPANLTDTAAAVRAALGELQLPVVEEKRDGDGLVLDSRVADGDKIHIQITPVASRVPADPASTHLSVRVGNLGDEALSRRVLDQVSLHLVAPVQMRPPVPIPTAPPGQQAWLPPAPHESAAPPLAK